MCCSRDPVAARIDRATRALRRISEDRAIELSKLTDDEYRALQEEYAEDAITSSTTETLPNRNPEDFSELRRQPIDVSGMADASEEAVRMRAGATTSPIGVRVPVRSSEVASQVLPREYARGLAQPAQRPNAG